MTIGLTQPSGLQKLLASLGQELSTRRQIELFSMLWLMLLSAILEVVSVGAILPFLGVLTAPETVYQNKFVKYVADYFGVVSASQLLAPLTIGFIGAIVIAGAVRMVLLFLNTRLAFAIGADLSVAMYWRLLNQPYEAHLEGNSGEVISGIVNKANIIGFNVILQLLILVSASMLVVGVTLLLILINPFVAILTSIGFGVCYGGVSWLVRTRLTENSQTIALEQTEVVKALQEGMGGIRDILLDNTQHFFRDLFSAADRSFRRASGDNLYIGNVPRIAVEMAAMVIIAAVAFFFTDPTNGVMSTIPVLGAMALGAQRLLPAFNQCYTAWASMIGSRESLADVIKILELPLPEFALQQPHALSFSHSIQLINIRFRYGTTPTWVLDGLNLTIPKGCRLGLIGGTGSGKTTTMDILMGLLTPTEGELQVDGRIVTAELIKAWQRNIAHVPQHIFLTDRTVAENIAFGVPKDAIDIERVKQAAIKAQLSDFIENRAGGYDAVVGERGVRLSGGQRQRIGIARALYKQATVLVFDEATSALDVDTESSVMASIQDLDRDLTIILIAHRMTTLKCCDSIARIERGRVVLQGSYADVVESETTTI